MSNTSKPLGLVYKKADELDIFMDVYIPEEASQANQASILLWWHGGGLLQGTRKALSPHMFAAPSKYNLCVVSVDYRLAPQTRFPGILSDCKDAIEYIKSPEFASKTGNRTNPSKLVLSGSSAGGWLSLLSGTGIGYAACGLEPPPPVTGIAALYPITDLLDPFWKTKQHPVSYMDRIIDRSELEPFINPNDQKATNSAVDSKRSIFYHYMVQEALLSYLLLDGTDIAPDAFSVAQSLRSRKFAPPPVYIIHGTKDDKVPHRQATDVVAALRDINAEVEYHEMEGLDHGFEKDASYGMETMYEFIYNLVKS